MSANGSMTGSLAPSNGPQPAGAESQAAGMWPKPPIPLNDCYGYITVTDNIDKTETESPLRCNDRGLVAKDGTATLEWDGVLIIDGECVKPSKWGFRISKKGQIYEWIYYRGTFSSVFVHLFRSHTQAITTEEAIQIADEVFFGIQSGHMEVIWRTPNGLRAIPLSSREFLRGREEGWEYVGTIVGAKDDCSNLGVDLSSICNGRKKWELPPPEYDAIVKVLADEIMKNPVPLNGYHPWVIW